MKWYWILVIVVVALSIGYGISIAINGGGVTAKIGKGDKNNEPKPKIIETGNA